MKIDELFSLNLILLDFVAKNKTAALKELTRNFARVYPNINQTELLQSLIKREELGSTGIGDGVALPHATASQLDRPKILLAVSKRGVEFNALDQGLVHFIILIVYPPDFIGRQTEVLSKVARVFREKALRNLMLKAESSQKIIEILKTQEGG